MTTEELVLETIEYYKTHNRGVKRRIRKADNSPYEGGCHYLTNRGDMCAVGRCLIDAKEFEKIANNAEEATIYEVAKELALEKFDVDSEDVDYEQQEQALDEYLKKEYRGFDIMIWSNLQNLHDNKANWKQTDKGWELSDIGKASVKSNFNIDL